MHKCIYAYMHLCVNAYMHTCVHAYMHSVFTSCPVLSMGQKILTLSRILTKCFKWSENGQKIRTKSENAAEDSEEETNTIMLTLYNTLIDTFIITSKFFWGSIDLKFLKIYALIISCSYFLKNIWAKYSYSVKNIGFVINDKKIGWL